MNQLYNDLKNTIEKVKFLAMMLLIGVGLIFLVPIYKFYVAYEFSLYLIAGIYGSQFVAFYNLYWCFVLGYNIFSRWSGLALLFGSIVVNYWLIQSIVSF